jgi:hypothetical protein
LSSIIDEKGEFHHIFDPNSCQIKYRINDNMDVVIQVLAHQKKKIKKLDNRKDFKTMILKDTVNNKNLKGYISSQAVTILQEISKHLLKLL